MNFFNDVGYILINHWPNFLRGVLWTLVISLVATLIGLVIGLIIGIIRTIPKSKNGFVRVIQKVIDFILSAYIEVFRGTPMMVQLIQVHILPRLLEVVLLALIKVNLKPLMRWV